MVAFGYTLLSEQRGPCELVADAVAAERAGFDFEVISDQPDDIRNLPDHALSPSGGGTRTSLSRS